AMEIAREVEQQIKSNGFDSVTIDKLLAPVPNPTSCRDAYAFRQHVASARRNRGVDMIPEFDQFPIFYFTNHNAVYGEGDVSIEKDHLHKLDFELEWAVVIGKHGRNVSSKDADDYIAGFTIMNDLSARLLQMEEMKLNLGPAKGKDFATTIGPWLVTKDELEDKKTSTDFGNQYDLEMKAFHNGNQVSLGNTKDMTYTFAEIIERVSYGVDIHPGDVIGSGTVGTGCYLELNGTWRREAEEKNEDFNPIWLGDGDEMKLEVDGLGVLNNKMKLSNLDLSILSKKKNI
ncbi:fumarylacetoacetate hydrolase family protein, partial [Candidatus Kapabacteria bacterium]|nr:fumarylacetoacetate hydrolase family protein [Candidatus Kapabacteria bacterium]